MSHIINGNAIDELRQLPSNSVHCIVTSPPYYMLRDYLTGKWEGGDETCNHRRDTKNANPDWVIQQRWKVEGGVGDEIMKSKCTKCGAVRVDQQIGLEETPKEFIQKLVEVFREANRVLHPTGTMWVNIADTYTNSSMKAHTGQRKDRDQGGMPGFRRKVKGMKRKDLIGIPWMLAFALRDDGWYLRQDIIWNKPNPMPESVTDRCTKGHEYLFLFTKSEKYYFDAEAIKQEPSDSYKRDPRWKTGSTPDNDKEGYELAHAQNPKAPHRVYDKGGSAPKPNKRSTWAINDPNAVWEWLFKNAPLEVVVPMWEKFQEESFNKSSVWTITTKPSKENHFATYPEELPADCIKAGSSEKGCCSKCGNPWKRVISKTLVPTSKAVKNAVIDQRDLTADPNDQGSNRQKDGHKPGFINQTETLKWVPTCKCDAPIIPCTVLDMFAGTGTTCRVAVKLGRQAIGIELNEKTAARARVLLEKTKGLFQ